MRIVLLTRAMHSSAEVLPALALLNHSVRVLGAEPASLLAVDNSDVLLVDGRMDLPAVRSFTRLLCDTGAGAPVLLVTTEGNLAGLVQYPVKSQMHDRRTVSGHSHERDMVKRHVAIAGVISIRSAFKIS